VAGDARRDGRTGTPTRNPPDRSPGLAVADIAVSVLIAEPPGKSL